MWVKSLLAMGANSRWWDREPNEKIECVCFNKVNKLNKVFQHYACIRSIYVSKPLCYIVYMDHTAGMKPWIIKRGEKGWLILLSFSDYKERRFKMSILERVENQHVISGTNRKEH